MLTFCDGVRRALGREPTDFAEYARRVAESGLWDEQEVEHTGAAA